MLVLAENHPALRSFIPVSPDSDFPIQNLPFGIFEHGGQIRAGVAIGDQVLDLAFLEQAGFFKDLAFPDTAVFDQPSLNAFLALGLPMWRKTRARISHLLQAEVASLRDHPKRSLAFFEQATVRMHLPVCVSGYTDFYSSLEHARNLGKLFRPNQEPLLPNWRHLPVGYDGRASSIVVSGTDFHRPWGQIQPQEQEPPLFAPTRALDTEVELAFVVGVGNAWGRPVSVQAAREHVFGVVLLSDFSARDIQKWEYVPLGPFLGKNFCTAISPWMVSLDALEPFRLAAPIQDPQPLPYLRSERNWNYDIQLSLSLKTAQAKEAEVLSRVAYRDMYWDFCQQLAHHSSNGCPLQTGDLLACGTISNAEPGAYGSLLELSQAGRSPLKLRSGAERSFLQDGDCVIISGYCERAGLRVGLGSVATQVLPALHV